MFPAPIATLRAEMEGKLLEKHISDQQARKLISSNLEELGTLTNEDAEAIKSSAKITTVKNVSPEYSSRAQVTAGRNNTNTQVFGVEPIYAEVRKLTLTSGMQNQDDRIYVPLTTAQKQLFGAKYLTSIALEAISETAMTKAQNQVGYLLLARHKIADVASADFRIMSQADILETASAVAGTFTSMLTGVAAISLLVGGIGIMNIMLMSVTERTREIGLRKALGATKKVIISQFLIESVILTFMGGIFGITLGIIGFYLYSQVNRSIFVVSPSSVLLAFAVSAGIGILFGWYPAQKAANLQPIETLRYE